MPSKVQSIGSPWNFSVLWNKALDAFPERPLVPRSHIWASELGQSYITRYLRMYGVPMTNPPNQRSKRKFLAGHMWEWVIKLVLTMCGVLKQSQLRTEVEMKGLLKVTGKMDFVAGGEVDWGKAKEEIKRIQELFSLSIDGMPDFIFYAIDYIVKDLEQQFKKNPLKLVIFEAKSISSFMATKVEKVGAMSHHVLQAGHYIIGEKMDEAYLFYICKDDTIGQQFSVENSAELLKAYKSDVKQMTEYYNAGFNPKKILELAPPKDPEINFIKGVWRFEKNFFVEYSPYLTMLYGYKDPEAYRYKWQRNIASWNRVFKRCVKGENITPKNEVVINEAEEYFPQWDKYVKEAKKVGAFTDPETEEEDI